MLTIGPAAITIYFTLYAAKCCDFLPQWYYSTYVSNWRSPKHCASHLAHYSPIRHIDEDIYLFFRLTSTFRRLLLSCCFLYTSKSCNLPVHQMQNTVQYKHFSFSPDCSNCIKDHHLPSAMGLTVMISLAFPRPAAVTATTQMLYWRFLLRLGMR